MKVCWLTDNLHETLFLTKEGPDCSVDVVTEDQDLQGNANYDLLILSANTGKNVRAKRQGIEWLKKARRDFFLTTPAIIYSFESFETLSAEFSIITSKGVTPVRLPIRPEEFTSFVEQAVYSTIGESELTEIVYQHCNLLEEWQRISHTLGNLIPKYEKKSHEIRRIVDNWARSINRFAPDHEGQVDNLQKLLNLPPALVNTSQLSKILENLDDIIQGWAPTTGHTNSSDYFPKLPQRPPKGFSKVLIADDEPQSFLSNSLRVEYGYDVVEQAFRFSRAKELLDKEKPDVILSDYYFKESSRKTEVPDKSVGVRFIRYALTHPRYTNTTPKRPIVLVTSKATLKGETEIPYGAINCSGANRATNPMYIHGLIWAEARKWDVTEPEELLGQEWTLEHTCRQRLDHYAEHLPKLITQCGEFQGTVRDTLRLCRLLSKSARNDDPDFVNLAINVLEPYGTVKDFSLAEALAIIAETERMHQKAKSPPESEAKQAIRNILHDKILQFSSVSNAINVLIGTLLGVSQDLMSLPSHRLAGQRIATTFETYSESEPLSPFLKRLNEDLVETLSGLPEVPPPPPPLQTRSGSIENNVVNIVVVEDNDYWRDYLIGAIKKTKAILDDHFSINHRCFDNAADALAFIPSSRKSFAIDGSDPDESKTIVIADICLPKNRDHAERIRATAEGRSHLLDTPHSTHGLSLIRRLCDYRYNVPMIIFSTVDSIADRKTIGSWGVPDEDFLAKDIEAEDAVVRALVRKIEKKTKYVIRRYEAEGSVKFWINGVEIPFTEELLETFSAFYGLCQGSDRNEFPAAEIAAARYGLASEDAIKAIQDQMYRIRKLIFEKLRSNRIFVSVRELIRTRKSFNEEFTYQLNAEVTPQREEDDYEDDVQRYENERCKVLVIENNPQALAQVNDILQSAGYEVRHATNVEDAVSLAEEFLPHVVSLDLQIPRTRAEAESPNSAGDEYAGLDAWKRIRTALSANTLGVVVPTVNFDKNYLIAKAAQMEIPIRNFISKHDANWLNSLLQKVAHEKVRVFLGEITDAARDIEEPVVEVLAGSNLSAGVLRLIVNGFPFTMRSGTVSKIIGHLLANPKTLQSLDRIATVTGKDSPGTNDDFKNWTKRIRKVIKERWLTSVTEGPKDLAEKILEYSAKGMRLNVQVIDRRDRQS